MQLLISGLLLWSIVHFIPSIGIAFKTACISRFGNKLYMAVFSLLIVLSLVLIVLGWRSTIPEYLYSLPPLVKPVALILIVISFLLFGAAKYQTRIKSVVRHPQLASVVTWSIAHLLLNGDSRAVVLFGGLGCWAVLEMIFINRRQGQWIKPENPAWKVEIKGAVISLVIFTVAVFLHPYFAGVAVK